LFWGWIGSSTNLTCIANGNPLPLIRWRKDGQDKSKDRGDVIVDGTPTSNSKTRAISYLIVSSLLSLRHFIV
jgi:hypothetical protein